jgi:hypothetical protein
MMCTPAASNEAMGLENSPAVRYRIDLSPSSPSRSISIALSPLSLIYVIALLPPLIISLTNAPYNRKGTTAKLRMKAYITLMGLLQWIYNVHAFTVTHGTKRR